MDEKRRIGNGLEMDWKWIGNGLEMDQKRIRSLLFRV